MKTADKVCSLTQAKRLVELGVVLETEKAWHELGSKNQHAELCINSQPDSKVGDWVFPAPDVAELGVLLPVRPKIDGFLLQLTCYRYDYEWYVDYTMFESTESHTCFRASTEAQSRCASLIWLLVNGHLKPGDCKL